MTQCLIFTINGVESELRVTFGSLILDSLQDWFYLAIAAAKFSASMPPQGVTCRCRPHWPLIGNGLTNREIGATLFLSVKTIKLDVTDILQKLRLRSRDKAA